MVVGCRCLVVGNCLVGNWLPVIGNWLPHLISHLSSSTSTATVSAALPADISNPTIPKNQSQCQTY